MQKKKLNENWYHNTFREPKKILIFNNRVFLRHPDDDTAIEHFIHPEYTFKADETWQYYWPMTDEVSGFIALQNTHNKKEIRIVLIEDIIYYEKEGDITIIEE